MSSNETFILIICFVVGFVITYLFQKRKNSKS